MRDGERKLLLWDSGLTFQHGKAPWSFPPFRTNYVQALPGNLLVLHSFAGRRNGWNGAKTLTS